MARRARRAAKVDLPRDFFWVRTGQGHFSHPPCLPGRREFPIIYRKIGFCDFPTKVGESMKKLGKGPAPQLRILDFSGKVGKSGMAFLECLPFMGNEMHPLWIFSEISMGILEEIREIYREIPEIK